MAFYHGKVLQLALRDAGNTWRDFTSYSGEVTLPAKAGIAETTVFGRGAKTFIGGLLEGQVTLKGFYDDTATTGPDFVLASLLGTQPNKGLTVVAQVTSQSNYGQIIVSPGGALTGVTCVMDAVLTDYSISAPVNSVISWNASFQLSGATTASGTLNGGTTTGAYGLQIIRAASSVVFNTAWIAGAGGSASYAALMGTTKQCFMMDPLADPVVQIALFKQSLGEMKKTLDEIHTEMREYNKQSLNLRLSKVESSIQWVSRTLIGMLVSAPLAIFLAYITTRAH